MIAIPVLTLIRVALGALFFWSGFLKLLAPWQNFQAVIEAYQLLHGEPVRWAAQFFPWAEAIGGLFLMLGLYTRTACLGLWFLNTAFIVALAQALVRKLPIRECGCFGDSFSLPLPVMLTLDIALWVCFGAVYLWDKQAAPFSLDQWFDRSKSKVSRRPKN